MLVSSFICSNAIAIFDFISVKNRNYCLFTITLIMYSLGVMVSVGGLIMVNAMGIVTSYSCGSSNNFGFGTTTTATPCTTYNFNYAQIGLGALCIVLCITFICMVNCTVGGFKRVGYNNGMGMNGMNGMNGMGMNGMNSMNGMGMNGMGMNGMNGMNGMGGRGW